MLGFGITFAYIQASTKFRMLLNIGLTLDAFALDLGAFILAVVVEV